MSRSPSKRAPAQLPLLPCCRRGGRAIEAARRALAQSGSREAAYSDRRLSHGERRALEVGMTFASRPRLMLLDEPMAGMGARSRQRMEAADRRL